MSTFKYQPLDPSEKQIRLLRLPSDLLGDDFEGTLETVSLNDCCNYNALSYVWGSPDVGSHIRLSGCYVTVTPNLKEALIRQTQFAHDSRVPGLLWVDALCINQDDLEEKSLQLALMKDIYAQARATSVSLGRASRHSLKAVEAISRLSQLALDHGLRSISTPDFPDSNGWQAHALRDIALLSVDCVDDSSDVPLHCLVDFIRNPWWRRVWTLQEASLARRTIIISCGPSMLCLDAKYPFDRLAQLLYVKHQITRQVHGKGIITTTLLCLANLFFQFSESLGFINRDDCKKTLIAALEVVNMDRREASDPRDHYFGILGIVTPQAIESHELRSLSYKNSTADIYMAVAHALYKEHGIEILGYCHTVPFETTSDGRKQKAASASRLPSWVPNWAGGSIGPLQKRLRFRELHLYRASSPGAQTANARFAIDGASLKVKGIVLDRLRAIVPKWDASQLPGSDNVRESWAPWISVILDLLSDSYIYEDLRAKLHAIFRTSCADCVREITGVGGLCRTNANHEALFDELISEYQSITAGQAVSYISSTELDDYIHVIELLLYQHWNVVITENGHLGLGRRTCLPRDIICIIHTASTPYILRPITSNDEEQKYTLVGESYIHGFMDGECVPTASNTQTFTLI